MNTPQKTSSGTAGRTQGTARRHAVQKKKWTFKRVAATAGKGLLVAFLICFISGCIIFGALTFYVVKTEDPGPLDLSQTKLNYTTTVYANDPQTGQPVEIDRLYKGGNRIWVNLDKIPLNIQNAFIAIEDQRFRQHDGVDWKRTVSAFANFYLHFWNSEQGGSTITQQLVKQVTSRDEKNFTRKIQEILSALATEKQYSKDQILQAYLNTIPLGNGCYGVQTAAGAYFNKDVSKLDLSQCALIAGLTKSPSTYDPFDHPDKAIARRNVVLDDMLAQKLITKQQHDAAVNEKLTFTKNSYLAEKNEKRSYFVDQVIVDITNDLVSQKGYTKEYAQSIIFSQGLKIYTTMNPTVQNALEKVYANDANFPKYAGKTQPQSAMIVVDYSGRVVGLVGGRGQKNADMILNRTQTKRQPGSSIKPLAVYSPAMDLNQITWSTVLDDSAVTKVQDDKTGEWQAWPHDDDAYAGYMPLVQGLAESRNTIAVRVMQLIGPQRSYDFLTSTLGFTSLVASRNVHGKVYTDIGLSLAIGAVTDGVTLREMAGGYEIFGNGGNFIKPYTYTKVVDANGNVVIASKTTSIQAIKPDTAFVMNKLLQQVVTRSDGTAHYLSLPGQVVAGKTGTTDQHYDRWFVGMTPYYVGAVWFGFDQPKDVGYKGTNPAVEIWQDVMQIVHKGLAYKDFPTSDNVVQLPYNIDTGRVTSYAGYGTDMGWYRTSDIPGYAGSTSYTTPTQTNNSKPSTSSSKKPSTSSSTSAASSSKTSSGGTVSGTSSASPASSSGSGDSSSQSVKATPIT